MSEQEDKFMDRAIKEAKRSKESIGCGCVIVKNNKVVAKGHNVQNEKFNAAAHAEINAIGRAGRKLKSKRLEDCIMYCTCEPCIMCLAAASYAKVKKIVFGLTMKETYELSRIIDIVNIEEFIKYSPHKFEYVSGFNKEKCKELLLSFE